MYDQIHTEDDVLRERFIFGAELTKRGNPYLERVSADGVGNFRAVPFNLASAEKNPKKCIAHFYINDNKFEKVLNYPEKYIEILRNFRYVIGTDFSAYDDMPLVLQEYQYFRDKALTYFLNTCGVNMIPNCGWGGRATWDFCFDGLPERSVLAISTNGRLSEKEDFIAGFHEMEKRLKPTKIVCVGKPIPVDTDVPIIYLESFSQQYERRRASGKGKAQDQNEQSD